MTTGASRGEEKLRLAVISAYAIASDGAEMTTGASRATPIIRVVCRNDNEALFFWRRNKNPEIEKRLAVISA